MIDKLGSKFFLSAAQIRSIVIPLSTSFKEAIKVIDNGGLQVVLVDDNAGRLIGIITDGDLRRAVLGGVKLTESVKVVVKKDFCSIISEDLNNYLSIKNLSRFTHVPVLSDDRKILGLLVEKHMRFKPDDVVQKNDTPVVIMAGGVGSRLAPFTKILPKPLLPVGEETIIERILSSFKSQGFWNFVVILNYKRELIRAYFAEIDKSFQITFVDEPTFLGTAGGLSHITSLIKGDFILSNADILLDIDYLDALRFHGNSNSAATIITVNSVISVPYGVVECDDADRVSVLQEKPSITHSIVSGVYLFSNDVFGYLSEGDPLNMDELLNRILKDRGIVTAYKSGGTLHDMGDFQAYRKFLEHFSSF